MGLAALDAALSGLRVSQQQINVISNNVANVGTPGFTRKILPQSAQTLLGVTNGVNAETIIRKVDLNLERDLWTQVSAVGQFDIQKSYLQRVEQFHGPPDKELSIAAELGRLKDDFSALSDNPSDSFLQAAAVNGAVDTVNKINNFSKLITSLRNDAQSDMKATVDKINDLLVQIADLNKQIAGSGNVRRSVAELQDKRDSAINDLAGLIDISFFTRGDGVLVVQTNQGVELASQRASKLTFNPTPQSATTYYPASSAGIFVSDPLANASVAVDITDDAPGGRLGGLIELRDTIFPRQMAQLDEMAHKMALRFEEQGLKLFTDGSGNVPADTPPDATTLPNPTPVSYVGFSNTIRVNPAVLSNKALLQQGTTGGSVQSGSNEVIARVVEFTFGSVDYQQILNSNPATSVDLLHRGGASLQSWLGLFSSNTVSGNRDLSAFPTVNDLVLSANGALDDPKDQFQITFEDARVPLGPTTITVDLSVADGFPGASAIDRLVAHINSAITAAAVPAGLAASASVGPNGQLVINTRGSIEIDAGFGPTGMGQNGLNFLGLVDNAGNPIPPKDPYFDIQVGSDDPVRITLEPGDTHADLLAKLQAVDGLAVDTAGFAVDGFLRLRPGNDYANPDFGGSIKITGGPFETDNATLAGPPALAGRTSLDDGVNIVSALFGTYSDIDPGAGVIIQDNSPVSSVGYQSRTDGSLGPGSPSLAFRTNLLGPGANISTQITGATALVDFAQKMVNQQIQDVTSVTSRGADEDTLRQSLQTRLQDESGVNLDEELGNLIIMQTAYAASARVISAVDDLFKQLLNSI